MKNSFFLVIPTQENIPEQLATYEKAAINQWIAELPTANPGLATRLFYDFIKTFNTVAMPPQQRLDTLELLRSHYLTLEEYLRSRLMLAGFPKGENEHKILALTVSIEKHFTIGYWIATRELTRRDVGWFQGKTVALAIQRTIKGLSSIVVSYYMMFASVPDWVWIDLHSLYKLSVTLNKETSKVADETCLSGKFSTIEDCYKQVLLLSLSDPSGLMQKEVQQVYHFIGQITQYISIEKEPVTNQVLQCVILMDEDASPYFDAEASIADSSIRYLNLLKLQKIFKQADKYISKDEARFSSMQEFKNSTDKQLPQTLFEYLHQSWQGIKVKGNAVFNDRLDRNISIGLEATHALLLPGGIKSEMGIEYLAESYSSRELSCLFKNEGILSIGSLVSFRKTDDPVRKRALGVVIKITMPKKDKNIVFELSSLTTQSYPVTYQELDADPDGEHHKALLYGVKSESGEKSFIIMDSFIIKDGDILNMSLNKDSFPIILGGRKNIGLGYWQFECRKIEDEQFLKKAKAKKAPKKQGYDFI